MIEFAETRRPDGTRLGTLASRAGCQKSVRVSIRNETRNSIARLSTNTRDSTSSALSTSATIIVSLRLNRSARTPDTAPNNPGSMRAVKGTRIPVTPPIWSARAIVANSATQSPKLDTTPAHHRRAKGPLLTRLNGRALCPAPSTMADTIPSFAACFSSTTRGVNSGTLPGEDLTFLKSA